MRQKYSQKMCNGQTVWNFFKISQYTSATGTHAVIKSFSVFSEAKIGKKSIDETAREIERRRARKEGFGEEDEEKLGKEREKETEGGKERERGMRRKLMQSVKSMFV